MNFVSCFAGVSRETRFKQFNDCISDEGGYTDEDENTDDDGDILPLRGALRGYGTLTQQIRSDLKICGYWVHLCGEAAVEVDTGNIMCCFHGSIALRKLVRCTGKAAYDRVLVQWTYNSDCEEISFETDWSFMRSSLIE